MDDNRIILNITPQPQVRFNSGKGGDVALFFIPEDCRSKHRVSGREKDKGKPCKEYVTTGNCPHILSYHGRRRKRSIERYNKYRQDLYHLAKVAGFIVPPFGMSLYFHFPMPIRWSKKKKAMMYGQIHLRTPDQDGCQKAFFDALTGTDEQVGQLSGVGKFWTDKESGFIEILLNQPIYSPYDVQMMPGPVLVMSSYEERLKARQVRKKQLEEEREKEKSTKKRTPKPLKVNKTYLVDELK